MSRDDRRVGTGASRVRRLLSRALLVVGGTVAGTAAAWALSTAAASAQVPVDRDAVTEVAQGAVAGGAADSTLGVLTRVGETPVGETTVGRAVQDLDTALRTPRVPEPGAPDLRRVADDLRGTVGHVGVALQPRPTAPVAADVVGDTAAQPATETTPAATAVPVSAGTPVVQGVFGAFSRTWQAVTSRPVTALPDTGGSSLPGDPSRLPSPPVAPLGAPAHCSCGGDGSGSSSGGSGPFTAGSADHTDSAVVRASLPATERNVVVPGKQPGATPD